jgi:hypothetical protein
MEDETGREGKHESEEEERMENIVGKSRMKETIRKIKT